MQTRNCLVRDHPREETSSSCDLLFFFALLLIPANLLWTPDKVTSSVQTSSGYHFFQSFRCHLFTAGSWQESEMLLSFSPVPGSLINITQVPQPPFFAPCKNPFNTNWLIDYTPTSSYSMYLQTQKSPPYHISRLCKDPIDIAEWSHLKNLLKSCFHQFSVFFKGNLTLWLSRTGQNCSMRLLWTSQTPNIFRINLFGSSVSNHL